MRDKKGLPINTIIQRTRSPQKRRGSGGRSDVTLKEVEISYSLLTGVIDKVSWDFVVKPVLKRNGFDLSKPIITHRDYEQLKVIYLQED